MNKLLFIRDVGDGPRCVAPEEKKDEVTLDISRSNPEKR